MADLSNTELLAIMAAMSSDEGAKLRTAELYESQKKHDQAKAAAEAVLAEANEAKAAGLRIAAINETERQTLAGRQAELEKFEQTLSDHNQTLIAEKASWEKIRAYVDVDQKNNGEKLAMWEEELIKREREVTQREQLVSDREKMAEELAAVSAMRIERMHNALHAIDPPPGKKDAKGE